MKKVRIVQLLCPQRHCIMATAYESPDGEEIADIAHHLKDVFEEWVRRGANWWCGICHSRSLTTEDRATQFSTMEDALPALAKSAAEQAITREYFSASKG